MESRPHLIAYGQIVMEYPTFGLVSTRNLVVGRTMAHLCVWENMQWKFLTCEKWAREGKCQIFSPVEIRLKTAIAPLIQLSIYSPVSYRALSSTNSPCWLSRWCDAATMMQAAMDASFCPCARAVEHSRLAWLCIRAAQSEHNKCNLMQPFLSLFSFS